VSENRLQAQSEALSQFGLTKLPNTEKTNRIQGIFSSVANRYDLMNDLMSGGLHRIWKHYTLNLINYPQAGTITDLACGSGDLLLGHAARMRDGCRLTGVDPNGEMLARAKNRLADAGVVGVALSQAPAEALPLENESQDLVTISFGLRNATDMTKALDECMRVLRQGGRLLILEFSHPKRAWLQQLYSCFSRAIPLLGEVVVKDRNSYQYLVDSIKTHPDQQTLAARMRDVGFALVEWIDLTGGIVAVHSGYKT